MHRASFQSAKLSLAGWLRSIARDQRGNVLVIVAAAIVPLLAIVGGGIDMGRGYMARTRLQQACDAGVLAARKKLGSTAIVGRTVPATATDIGEKFFRLNFRDNSYGTTVRPTFTMAMDTDFSIAGTATVNVPTTIMYMFGYVQLPITVQCSSQFNYSNTDIMMVLDTTGSMNETNAGDTKNKISVLRQVVKDFHTAVESAKSDGVRVRYGFVPYSTNVNVGYLLKSKWVDTEGTYEGRTAVGSGWNSKWRYASTTISFPSWTSGNSDNVVKGGTLSVKMGGTAANPTNINLTFSGCIEERSTYVIDNYANVDLTRARDLDIDSEPDSSNPATQWRPVLHEISWLRAVSPSGYGYWSPGSVDNAGDYLQASEYGFSACPSRARKLAEMTSSEVATYVDNLVPAGSTYHDIGMIWGGRLLSPTGIFASENVDVDNRPTMRHLIFLTDGQTAPSELSYGTYGIEPLSQRRWNSSSRFNLTQTVENRFTYACNAVKNKDITVWVVGFGTSVTPMLKNCAGSGHWFQANNASDLSAAFATIASAIGDLRITK
jgi:Flp pilus assembly protein TadG